MQRAVFLFETRTEPARDAALELVGARRVRTTELRLICGLCVESKLQTVTVGRPSHQATGFVLREHMCVVSVRTPSACLACSHR